MITFTLALLLLVVGYMVYGRYVDSLFGPDPSRKTPAVTLADGVDYIPLPTWKVFMIQFLNIAGLGPIFGAIMGAQFGTASYLWIVFGTIFAGAVHDFLIGTFSLRHSGESLPQLVGRYLGRPAQRLACVFTIILLSLLSAVFVSGPAELLAGMTPDWCNIYFWTVVIFLYYVLATLLPVDKIIGRFYPIFALALLLMAAALMVVLYMEQPDLPEIWNGLGTKFEQNPIFPMMFISIACGAISGFHATQSPLMARCLTNEKHCRPVFYGSMVTEGIVALIWAAAATCFYQEHGIINPETGMAYSGAKVAMEISNEWLGAAGGLLVILGIVAAPITSGDTALRSARLVIADFLHWEQRSVSRRLAIGIPLFLATMAVLVYSFSDAQGFKIVWRYFAWSNQILAVFTLWTVTVGLVLVRKNYWVTLLPALFMTCVCATYIFIAPEGFRWSAEVSYTLGGLTVLVAMVWFVVWFRKNKAVCGER